jgi:hypothetical protein
VNWTPSRGSEQGPANQHVQALAPATAPQHNARDRAVADVQAALALMAQGRHADAMARLLAAADALESIDTVPTAAPAAALARLVAETEARQCNSLPPCATSTPRIVNDGYFTPFGAAEGLQARGGAWGDDWEWGLGADLGTTGRFAAGQHQWVSGRQYGWNVNYDAAGNGRLTVLDGTSAVLSLDVAAAADARLRSGNAVQFGVRAGAAAGQARIDASVTKLQGQAVAGAQATRGDGSYSEGQLTYLLPAGPLSAAGTVRLSFPDLTPPPGSALRFSVQAGQAACRPQ